MREQGIDAEVALVNVNPRAKGFKVRCAKCGRRARVPFKLPADKVAACPRCQRSDA
jgi:CxxC-x17-CxxC domain-containing protein